MNQGVPLIEADGGKLQVRGCSFGSDEPSMALRPGLKHAIVTENNGVRRVEIINEIDDQQSSQTMSRERKVRSR